MRKYLGLRRYQVGIIITLVAVFAIVGFNATINGLEEKIKEEVSHEIMLQQRREKIDSLRIIEMENTMEDGTKN